MNIAFLSSLDPTDIHSWSGTLYYIYRSLQKEHRMTWIGQRQYAEVSEFHQSNFGANTPFIPEKYAPMFGKMLSDVLNYECYDLVVCRDYFFLAYLVTEIPVIYVGDTTFKLFNQYMQIKDTAFLRLAEDLEERAIQRASHIVYSSEWAKTSAVNDYHVDPEKISVIEFGANIEDVPDFQDYISPSTCNLLFIGTNWKMKGGDKLLKIYSELRNRGIDCTLTIIGSSPAQDVNDPNIKVYPLVDKSTSEGKEAFRQLLGRSHFLIAPTLFDCYGIVNCEAAAYGIPVLTSDVGGVSQVICEGENGFLMSVDAEASEYADKIEAVYSDTEQFNVLRKKSRQHFEERLNWETWRVKMNKVFDRVLDNEEEFYIPVYAINVKEREDRKRHIIKEFENRPEFQFNLIEACRHPKGTIGLWNSIVNIVKLAKEKEEDVIIICEDDHYFTENYSPKLLFKEIREAYMQGADVLSGGIGGFGQAIPVGYQRYWVDWFWCTQFIVVYASFFDKILSYQFKEDDTADDVMSALTNNKMVIYPFISEQKDFGYSDVTRSNMDNQGRIREHFAWANAKLRMTEQVCKLREMK